MYIDHSTASIDNLIAPLDRWDAFKKWFNMACYIIGSTADGNGDLQVHQVSAVCLTNNFGNNNKSQVQTTAKKN